MDFRFQGSSVLLAFFLFVKVLQAQGTAQHDVSQFLSTSSSKIKIKRDDEMCKRQMELLVEGYQNKSLWALRVFDAWGKSQSGFFSGNLVNFGHYEQCLAMKYSFKNPSDGSFKGQHCLIFFKDSPGTVNDQNPTNVQDLILPQVIHIELMRQYANFYNARTATALCLPSVCSPSMVREIAAGMLAFNSLKTSMDYD